MGSLKKIIITLAVLTVYVSAFNTRPGKTGRLAAMGSAALIIDDSLDAVFYNPASLCRSRSGKVSLLYSFYNKHNVDSFLVHNLAAQLPNIPAGSKNIFSGATVALESARDYLSDTLGKEFNSLEGVTNKTRYIPC